jgi:hypothetical protein
MITFVLCVESGWLEEQSVRLVKSIREFGGALATSPLIAVRPRVGSSISNRVKKIFIDQDVRLIEENLVTRYDWFPYYNKMLALDVAKPFIETPLVAFLDSDLVFSGEPNNLLLPDGVNFAAVPIDIKEQGTNGNDEFSAIWRRMCEILGFDFDSIPEIETAWSKQRIKLYFNSGIFISRGYESLDTFKKSCEALLGARITSAAEGYSEGLKEQGSLTFVAMGTRYQILDLTYNFPLGSRQLTAEFDNYQELAFRGAKIFHLHDSLWPQYFDLLIEKLKPRHPALAEMLSSLGPLKINAPITSRLRNRFLQSRRELQKKRYLAKCTIVA